MLHLVVLNLLYFSLHVECALTTIQNHRCICCTIVQIFEDQEYGYGPLIEYNILFDDGTVSCGIEDCYVYLTEDFESLGEIWIGVEAACDENSKDKWAKEVGWFVVTTMDGVSMSFPTLMEAVRAYDKAVVQKKGPETVAADLNLPNEWDWLPG